MGSSVSCGPGSPHKTGAPCSGRTGRPTPGLRAAVVPCTWRTGHAATCPAPRRLGAHWDGGPSPGRCPRSPPQRAGAGARRRGGTGSGTPPPPTPCRGTRPAPNEGRPLGQTLPVDPGPRPHSLHPRPGPTPCPQSCDHPRVRGPRPTPGCCPHCPRCPHRWRRPPPRPVAVQDPGSRGWVPPVHTTTHHPWRELDGALGTDGPAGATLIMGGPWAGGGTTRGRCCPQGHVGNCATRGAWAMGSPGRGGGQGAGHPGGRPRGCTTTPNGGVWRLPVAARAADDGGPLQHDVT